MAPAERDAAAGPAGTRGSGIPRPRAGESPLPDSGHLPLMNAELPAGHSPGSCWRSVVCWMPIDREHPSLEGGDVVRRQTGPAVAPTPGATMTPCRRSVKTTAPSWPVLGRQPVLARPHLGCRGNTCVASRRCWASRFSWASQQKRRRNTELAATCSGRCHFAAQKTRDSRSSMTLWAPVSESAKWGPLGLIRRRCQC